MKIFGGYVLACFIIAVVAFANGQCAISAGTYVTPSAARACYETVFTPANGQARAVQALKYMADLYAFADISTDSGEPFFIEVDLRTELDRIASQVYINDYGLQVDFGTLYARLGDAHTVYSLPRPYKTFQCVFPFSFQMIANGTSSVMMQINSPTTPYSAILGTTYNGLVVNTINNIPAQQFWQQMGDAMGVARSSAVRFNNAIINGAAPWVNHLLPASDQITFTFSGPTAPLAVPLQCLARYSYANSSQFAHEVYPSSAYQDDYQTARLAEIMRSEEYQQADVVPMGKVDLEEMFNRDLHRKVLMETPLEHQNLQQQQQQEMQSGARNVGDPTELQLVQISPDGLFACWNWPQQQALVIRMASLSPNGWEGALKLLETLQLCIDFQVNNSIPNVLLDLRQDGGGYVCLWQMVVALLVPEWAGGNGTVCEPYDIRKGTAFSSDPATIESLGGGRILFNNQDIPVMNNSWFAPNVVRSLGKAYSPYTPRGFYPYCGTYWVTENPPTFQKLLVLSDGLCGSSCSALNSKLRYYGHSLVVTTGGNFGADFDSSSFSGGNVWAQESIVALFAETGSQLPPNFLLPSTARTAMNYNAMYMGSQQTWREFDPIFSDFTPLPLWNFQTDPLYRLTPMNYSEYLVNSGPTVALTSAAALFLSPLFEKTARQRALGSKYFSVPFETQGSLPVSLNVTGYVAAVIILVLFALLAVGVIVYLCWRSKKQPTSTGEEEHAVEPAKPQQYLAV
eukprot:TRINITY_DN13885_c0_g1_i1.p1 TRINITY_DN13885_c0_g1~~TRINITY_DN13885_c0_g1_i1.p1  ORF type:complete len:741 (-),score=172.18 TRINITY_DN13885_c0_g1_i1:60-2282(-)